MAGRKRKAGNGIIVDMTDQYRERPERRNLNQVLDSIRIRMNQGAVFYVPSFGSGKEGMHDVSTAADPDAGMSGSAGESDAEVRFPAAEMMSAEGGQPASDRTEREDTETGGEKKTSCEPENEPDGEVTAYTGIRIARESGGYGRADLRAVSLEELFSKRNRSVRMNPGEHEFDLTADMIWLIIRTRDFGSRDSHMFLMRGSAANTRCDAAASWSRAWLEKAGGEEDPDQIRERFHSACIKVLDMTRQNELHSIAFPSVPGDVGTFTVEDQVLTAVTSVVRWLQQNDGYGMSVEFCCDDERTYRAYSRILWKDAGMPETPEPKTEAPEPKTEAVKTDSVPDQTDPETKLQERPAPSVILYPGGNTEWMDFAGEGGFQYLGSSYAGVEDYLERQREQLLAGRKRPGRSVWNRVQKQIMRRGAREKFRQNPELMRRLLATDYLILGFEGTDGMLETGLSEGDERNLNVRNWQGKNLKGRILMEVRRDLRLWSDSGSDIAYRDYRSDQDFLAEPIWEMRPAELVMIPGAAEAVMPFAEVMSALQPSEMPNAEEAVRLIPRLREVGEAAAAKEEEGGVLPQFHEMMQELYDLLRFGGM